MRVTCVEWGTVKWMVCGSTTKGILFLYGLNSRFLLHYFLACQCVGESWSRLSVAPQQCTLLPCFVCLYACMHIACSIVAWSWWLTNTSIWKSFQELIYLRLLVFDWSHVFFLEVCSCCAMIAEVLVVVVC